MEGYSAGGDYITGYHYFYLNFSPIWILEYEKDKMGEDGSKIIGNRINDFPLFWDGDYKFFHYLDEAEKVGKHAVCVKCRGRGFSFKSASMGLRNYYCIPGSKSFYVASDKKYLIEDGVLNKAWEIMSFVDGNTPWSKLRQFKDTIIHKKASYKIMENGVVKEKGYKSEIIGMSVDKDVDQIRGKRGKLLVIEEGGNLSDITKLVSIARSGMEQGKITFGLILSFGTGGEEYEDLEGLEELFYYPDSYNIYSIPNTWDKIAGADSRCGFFFPSQMNYEGYYDKDGNSDFITSKKIEEKVREDLRLKSKSNKTVLQYIAENPFEPREAFLKQTATIFPVSEIRERLAELEINHDKYRNAWWVGKLFTGKDGDVMWKIDNSMVPLESYPIKDNDIEGCVVIYEMPYRNDSGEIPRGIYIAGCDPYGQDDSFTDSVGSVFIMNVLNERIVAEYTGRPSTTFEFYDNAVKLLAYYRALCNYENDIKGLYDYCYNNGYLHLLSETPEILLEKDVISQEVSGRKYGTPGTPAVINWGLQLLKQYLLAHNPVEKDILNTYKIQSPGLLKELLHWSPKGNFDRIRAMSYLLILKQEYFKIIGRDKTKLPYSPYRDKFWDRPFQKTPLIKL